MARKTRCVLVDDDPEWIRFTVRCLGRTGRALEIVSFSGGIEALEYLQRTPADLIITDFSMPRGDGFFLTEAVRKLDPSVRILLVSGDEAAGREALAHGATAFLPKCQLLHGLPRMLDWLLAPAPSAGLEATVR